MLPATRREKAAGREGVLRDLSCGVRWLRLLAFVLAAALACAPPASAQNTVADFYRGKTVTIVVTTAVGTGYDYGARILALHFGRHIPGNPTIVVQNRPGGGG